MPGCTPNERRRTLRDPDAAFRELQRAQKESLANKNAPQKTVKERQQALLRELRLVKAKINVRTMLLSDHKFNVLNHAAFKEKVFQYLRNPNPTKRYSFAILDIDGFKQVNDRLGYIGADKIILNLITMLQEETIRHGGVVGRFGGDEIVIFLPHSAKTLAQLLGQAKKRFNQEGNRFSAGIADAHHVERIVGPSKKFGQLHTVAEQALRRIKRGPKNFVAIAP